MLSAEANERLARVGPGTPCGELIRRYWIPIAPFAQLLEDPVRPIRVLGEDLVLYRDRQGRLGLIGNRCLHRATNLRWGIPDSEGLRCAYHGWLYSAEGRCLDTPMEALDSTFKERLRIKAYPVEELGGLVFAYLGPQPAPLLPPWDLFVCANAVRQIGISVIDCNWLQCQENTGDPTHNAWLHGHMFKYVLEKMGKLEERAADQEMHTLYNRIRGGIGIKGLFARPTKYGMEKGIEYSQALGAENDRITRHATVIFPFYTQTGTSGQPRSEFQIRVPIDDTHTYHICYQAYSAPPGVDAPKQDVIPWYEIPIYDDHGRPILDYVLAQDMVAWWSQGDLTDRSQEKLGRTDIPIVFLRRQLEQQIRLVEDGGEPMNVFRDAAEMGETLYGSGSPPGDWLSEARAGWRMQANTGGFRAAYHRAGLIMDDADRYGPAVPLVQELHRRIEEKLGASA